MNLIKVSSYNIVRCTGQKNKFKASKAIEALVIYDRILPQTCANASHKILKAFNRQRGFSGSI